MVRMKKHILSAFERLLETKSITLLEPKQESLGDFAVHMKQLQTHDTTLTPEIIIQKLKKSELFDKVEKKDEFINVWIAKKLLFEQLNEFAGNKINFSKIGVGKKIVIEYSSPNIAKPFTIGHLRSTIIGDAIANLYEKIGYSVFRDNHVGDWGTQFGKQIYAIKKWGNEDEISQAKRPVKLLVDLYVKFHKEAEKHAYLENEARVWFQKLESGDPEARRLWQKCIDWSWVEFDAIYKTLNVSFTENNGRGYGESYFENKMVPIIEELKNKKLLVESDGAQLVFFPNDSYPPLMIIKNDGATLYATRDLATDKFRLEKYGKDIVIINEVGAEQSLYFRQLYAVEQLLGWYSLDQRIHVKHGLYRFKTGKMSTRKGDVIWLEDVLSEAIERAKKLSNSGNDDVAKQVAIGAIKWNDLKRGSEQDIVFDWDDLLNMQGNSGPYLQYTFARICSVLEKSDSNPSLPLNDTKLNEEEYAVLRHISHFTDVVESSALQFAPHILCNYLYELAQKFNTFYEKSPILKSEKESKQLRLALTSATGNVLKNGLGLLGIESPNKI